MDLGEAIDAGGLTHTTSVNLDPETVDLTLQTIPPGLTLIAGQVSQAAPYTRTEIVNSTVSLSAPSPQTLLGVTYAFASWSNGDDTWPTSRKRWFDSIRDYCNNLAR